jgi:U6 snRNA-associated Sm-like protein LSm7
MIQIHCILSSSTTTNIPPDEDGNTSTRSLGLLVARGTLLVLISPVDGSEEIENPFVQGEDEE